MVEFLVEHGADLNRGDNEGWTPLHATASCGFVSIAKYLIDNGANIAAVNCEGDLAVDIAESDEMERMLQSEINEQGWFIYLNKYFIFSYDYFVFLCFAYLTAIYI